MTESKEEKTMYICSFCDWSGHHTEEEIRKHLKIHHDFEKLKREKPNGYRHIIALIGELLK